MSGQPICGVSPRGPAGVARYFAYGSNMNPERMAARNIQTRQAMAATLTGYQLAFDKRGTQAGEGHANVIAARGAAIEGVLYELASAAELQKLDPFERTPINYSREQFTLTTNDGSKVAWVYIANPGARRPGLRPSLDYLEHLLGGAAYLSPGYLAMLQQTPTLEPGTA